MGGGLRDYIPLVVVLSAYFFASKYVFDRVYEDSKIVIDELFHLRQGKEYCKGNFTYWDPKITTLPGLYMVSTALLNPYFECNTYNLRFVNLLASCVNLCLFSSILNYVYVGDRFKNALQALNLTLLPPLYFFSHVYYTDTLSLTFLLAFLRLSLGNRYRFTSFFVGGFSVIMRQTNIIWVGLVPFHRVLDIAVRSSRVFGNKYINNMKIRKSSLISHDVDSSKLKRYYDLDDLGHALNYHFDTYLASYFKHCSHHDAEVITIHGFIVVLFSLFVLINGSIVVGDKQAHEASLHLPQLYYFLLFYGVFGLPHVLARLISTIKLMIRQKTKILYFIAIAAVIVNCNTLTHPYLLADNRHFTFYIWNRWYGKYDFAKYVTIPIYSFLFFSLYDNLKDQNCISFLFPYTICTIVGLVLQKMIEVRYFLIPFIIIRLRFARTSYILAIFELLWYVLINMAAFHVFFTKPVFWDDFDYVQRIIW